MIALGIMLATALIGAMALIAWLVAGRIGAGDHAADARVAQIATESELERAQFELEQTRHSLAAAERRQDILEQAVADAIAAAPNRDLAAGDVLSRAARITAEWAEADRARGAGSTTDATVPETGAAGASGPVVRPSDT